jgi:hypothetical protein
VDGTKWKKLCDGLCRHYSSLFSTLFWQNRDPARDLLSKVGADLRLAAEPTAKSILEVACNAAAAR